MLSKPFKPPLIKKQNSDAQHTQNRTQEPPAKRRRISEDKEDSEGNGCTPQSAAATSQQLKYSVPFRKPLVPVRNPPSPESIKPECSSDGPESYFMVLW